jgi:hypothetical protein
MIDYMLLLFFFITLFSGFIPQIFLFRKEENIFES